jgi:hypothetical protein
MECYDWCVDIGCTTGIPLLAPGHEHCYCVIWDPRCPAGECACEAWETACPGVG